MLDEGTRQSHSVREMKGPGQLCAQDEGPGQLCARDEGARAAPRMRGRDQGSSVGERKGLEPLCA